jgi:hypothetical protein
MRQFRNIRVILTTPGLVNALSAVRTVDESANQLATTKSSRFLTPAALSNVKNPAHDRFPHNAKHRRSTREPIGRVSYGS